MKWKHLLNLSIQNFIAIGIPICLFFSCSEESSPGPQPEPIPNPEFSTLEAGKITATTTLTGARLIYDDNLTAASFGLCYANNKIPTLNDDSIHIGIIMVPNWDVIIGLSSLSPNTKYYVRTYIKEYDDNIIYGNIISFTTLAYTDSITDLDGNIYHTVTIGTQVWTVENLRVTQYRNGDPIPRVEDQWDTLNTGAYCEFDNNPSTVTNHGLLYNWHAVGDNRNIAPLGWRVPEKSDWEMLINFLGGTDSAGIKMRQPGGEHWSAGPHTPLPYSSNESGFLALPSGNRVHWGAFYDGSANFWSATLYDHDHAWKCMIRCLEGVSFDSLTLKKSGLSIRLVKD